MALIKTGIDYYDNKVFPEINLGKKKFNWRSSFFGIYWFPYKGLWKEWALFFIPYMIIFKVLDLFGKNSIVLALVIAYIVLLGFQGNKRYYDKIQKGEKVANNIWHGIAGIVLYILLSNCLTFTWERIKNSNTTAFNSSTNSSTNSTSQLSQKEVVDSSIVNIPENINSHLPQSYKEIHKFFTELKMELKLQNIESEIREQKIDPDGNQRVIYLFAGEEILTSNKMKKEKEVNLFVVLTSNDQNKTFTQGWGFGIRKKDGIATAFINKFLNKILTPSFNWSKNIQECIYKSFELKPTKEELIIWGKCSPENLVKDVYIDLSENLVSISFSL